MRIQELLNENTPFLDDTTEMPYYDNMMQNPEYFRDQKGLDAKLVNMSPQEYIEKVAKNKKVTKEKLLANREAKRIAGYAKQMKEGGRKFPILTLDYSRGKVVSQEGLHRSFAAIQAGVKEVPVLIVKSTD